MKQRIEIWRICAWPCHRSKGTGGHHRVVAIGEGCFFTVSCFLEHKGSSHFLTFTVLQDHRAQVAFNEVRPWDFFPLVRNEVNDMWLIKELPVILEFYPSSLTLLKEWTAV